MKKSNGLIPAIIQDVDTRQVLMLGYMNKAALAKTRKDKRVTFYSRSKKRLWQKGESSGNYLTLISITKDCDNDTFLIMAKPRGPTCHTGATNCFKTTDFTIQDLFRLIQMRKLTMPKNSYTTSLLTAGTPSILAKISEESSEVIQAATKETRQRLIEESCDLIYHLLVLLSDQNINLKEVDKELKKRNKN